MTATVTAAEVVVWALIAVGVGLLVACSLGVWVFRRSPLDALHLTGPAVVVAPVPIAVAVVVEQGPTSMAGAKAVLVALLLIATGPVVGHATARAARIHERGRWELLPEERAGADEL